ncbi:hypothetical protein D9M72_490520 [compost metagenome]
MQALIGHEFEINLHVRVGLGEGLGHGAHIRLAIGGLGHEEGVERRFRMRVADEGDAGEGRAKQGGSYRFQHDFLQ